MILLELFFLLFIYLFSRYPCMAGTSIVLDLCDFCFVGGCALLTRWSMFGQL
jgi:hypothetical protein